MNRIFGAILIGAALLCGCGENSPPPDPHSDAQRLTVASNPRTENPSSPGVTFDAGATTPKPDPAGMNDVVAKVNGQPITMKQLVDPLIESHGLTMLVNLVELELARQNAAQYKVTVTEQDFVDERNRTLEKMFKDSDEVKLTAALDKAIDTKNAAEEARLRGELKIEREDYLTQFLLNQHIDSVEFNLVLKINTYLRKILEFDWKDKITEADVKAAFGQMYGERVRVEYLLLENMKEVTEVQRRLAAGDSFEQVAKDMSHDRLTAPLGGALPPFAHTAPEVKIPPVFRDTAFSMRDGQVSDPLVVGSSFMIVKRIELLPPVQKAVQLDDDNPIKGMKGVRDIVYRTLHDKLMDAGLKGLKQQLAAEARGVLDKNISNNVLKAQFDANLKREATAAQKAKDELDRQEHLKDKLTLPGTTEPSATQPTTGTSPATPGAAPQAPTTAAGERPPATQPGSAHVFALPPARS